MSRRHRNNTAALYSLLAVYLLLLISSLPSVTEARIPNFSAIQESLVHRSTAESMVRLTMPEVPVVPNNPVPRKGDARISQFSAIQENLVGRSTREVPVPEAVYSPVANPAARNDQH